jgi:hypothetical protein
MRSRQSGTRSVKKKKINKKVFCSKAINPFCVQLVISWFAYKSQANVYYIIYECNSLRITPIYIYIYLFISAQRTMYNVIT